MNRTMQHRITTQDRTTLQDPATRQDRTTPQHRTGGRRVTLNPFDADREVDARLHTESARPERQAVCVAHLGCVDWYLYPVSGTAQERRAG